MVDVKITLTVAIEGIGYFPFYYTENGDTKVFSVDVFNFVVAHSKYEFEYVILPWPRAIHFVVEGQIELILTLFKTSKCGKYIISLNHFMAMRLINCLL